MDRILEDEIFRSRINKQSQLYQSYMDQIDNDEMKNLSNSIGEFRGKIVSRIKTESSITKLFNNIIQ